MDARNKVEALLSRTVERGASLHEAHTAAVIAGKLARKNGLALLVARARVQEFKAWVALQRAAA